MSQGYGEERVLLACDFFLRYTSGLASGLRRIGARPAVLGRDHDLEFGGRPGASAEFLAKACPSATHWRLPGRVRSPRGLEAARRLRRSVRAFGPRWVHVQASITNDPRLIYVAGLRPGRFALTVHDPMPHPGDRTPERLLLANRLLIRGAGLIFVHGEALREELLAVVSPRAPIVVIPHGIEAAEIETSPTRPSVLFFGRSSHYKGLDVLVDAMTRVWQSVPGARLTIAADGPIGDQPVLADRRIIVRDGHTPDSEVPALFAGASCVALPYRQASQSGVGAMAKGYARPLVVTAVGGLPELVADGSGLVVPPEDPSALAKALVDVLSQPELAEKLSRVAARSARGAESWDEVAARTLDAYREYLPGGRR